VAARLPELDILGRIQPAARIGFPGRHGGLPLTRHKPLSRPEECLGPQRFHGKWACEDPRTVRASGW
jgi:hypothetical protein